MTGREVACLVAVAVGVIGLLNMYKLVGVIRLSRNPTPSELAVAIERLIAAFGEISINGSLWVVHRDRIRLWSPQDEGDG